MVALAPQTGWRQLLTVTRAPIVEGHRTPSSSSASGRASGRARRAGGHADVVTTNVFVPRAHVVCIHYCPHKHTFCRILGFLWHMTGTNRTRTPSRATRLGSRTPGHAGLTPPPGTRPQRRDRRERRCKHPGAPVLPRHNRDVPSRNTRLVVTLSRQQALKFYQSSQRPLECSSRRRWWRRWLSYMTRLRRCRPTEPRSRDFHRRRPR